jgi:hypothetical protein
MGNRFVRASAPESVPGETSDAGARDDGGVALLSATGGTAAGLGADGGGAGGAGAVADGNGGAGAVADGNGGAGAVDGGGFVRAGGGEPAGGGVGGGAVAAGGDVVGRRRRGFLPRWASACDVATMAAIATMPSSLDDVTIASSTASPAPSAAENRPPQDCR